MFFRKRKQTMKAAANGKVIPLEQVEDEVFSTKMVGDGFAVIHHDGTIYSPVAGTVSSIFPTKHALTLVNQEGVSLLIHLGLDTVELKGAPFSIKVTEGQQVSCETLLAVMDQEQLRAAKKSDVVIVVLPEGPTGKLVKANQKVTPQEVVFTF